MRSFHVKCSCPTPLAVNPFTCEAESEADAKRLFFEANGISGTEHPVEITQEVSEVVQPAKGKKKNEPQPTSGDQG